MRRSLLLLFLVSCVATVAAQAPPGLDFALTDEERIWLEEHPSISIGPAPNFPPMEFFDENGAYAGIIADYVKEIELRLGIEFEVERRENWDEVVEGAQSREIDIWMEAVETPERSEYMIFSEPYFEMPVVIIVRREVTGQLSLSEMQGQRVTVVESYDTKDYIRENFPDVELVTVPDVLTGLEAVSFGSVDAIVEAIAVASYYIENRGLINLRVAGESGYVWQLSMASRRDWPMLSVILAKALADIPEEKRREIYRRWVVLEAQEGPAWSLRLAIGIVVLLISTWLAFRYWWKKSGDTVLEEVRWWRTPGIWPIIGMSCIAIATVAGVSLWTLSIVQERARSDVNSALRTVLNTSSNAVYDWFRERQLETSTLARRPEIRQLSLELASETGDSGKEQELQQALDPFLEVRGYSSFSLLDLDGSILAENLEDEASDQAYELDEEFVVRILESPNRSAVLLPTRETLDKNLSPSESSILVASGIVDEEDNVQSILVLAVDPSLGFTEILQRGQIGESGETYAFNRLGQLLSESRFIDDLRRVGLVSEDQSTILQTEVRDPGGNLLTGYTPELDRAEQPLTLMVQAAMDSGAGTNLEGYNDYRGVPVVGAWVWDEELGIGIVSEIDVLEAYAFLRSYRSQTVVSAILAAMLMAGLTALFLTNRVKIAAANLALAKGAEELEKRNRFIRQTFGRYLSDDIVENILETPAGLKIGGETRLVTIMMTDIRGFTALGKQLPAETIVSMLNIYLEQMTDIIFKYKGTIDEFIGDAILVIFGAPFTQEDDAQRAAACALEMQVAMGDVNLQFREAGFPEVEMGIGLNTGEVVVGNIGSSKRSKYGVVGHNVNLTSRIESYTVGGQILISQATREECGPLLEIGGSREVMPKGVDQPITIFDVKGMGEPYDIHLPETKQEELCPLEQCLEMEFSVVEQKEVGQEVYRGELTALSDTNAALRCDFVPEIAQNLKVTLYPQNLEKGFSDIYTKVTQHESDSPNGFVVHFTSVPPACQSFLEELNRPAGTPGKRVL